MKLSSKGRVAVTSLVDMAIYCKGDEPIKLSDISKRQNISVSFLEQIFLLLRKRGIVRSRRGPSGGYTFAKNPELVMIYDVIIAIEENLKINNSNELDFACISADGKKTKCLTHNLWDELSNHISNFLTSISIEDVKSNNFLIKTNENVEKIYINH